MQGDHHRGRNQPLGIADNYKTCMYQFVEADMGAARSSRPLRHGGPDIMVATLSTAVKKKAKHPKDHQADPRRLSYRNLQNCSLPRTPAMQKASQYEGFKNGSISPI